MDDSQKPRTGTPPALGSGPNEGGKPCRKPYKHATAAWGAVWSVGRVLLREGPIINGTRAVFRMNHEGKGFDCPGCAWPDDRHGLAMDICENGVKHAAWEMTRKRCDPAFFAAHTVEELKGWSEFALEDVGRLTEPMAYDSATDQYVPIAWPDAFALIGKHLRGLHTPHAASFYTSGRLSNEATFMYQLFVREYGTNNLPDCSNMCHEASGRALKASIGTGKGTVDLHDWNDMDTVFVMGVNAATNAPRMLTALADGVKARGLKIVHVNPLHEAASTRAITPHDITDMLLFRATPTSTLNVQPRIAGDFAFLRGIAKVIFEMAATDAAALDMDFIQGYTDGFEVYRATVGKTPWDLIESQSGVQRSVIVEAAKIYRASEKCIFAWCLGISQQEYAVDTIREIVNVMLLRGHIGRKGAGPSPVRGHSNVQGNRTCGIDNKPASAWLDRMDAATGITSPRAPGADTVRTIEGMARGEIKVFVGMGGNFAMAAPDTQVTIAALERCDLTVQVSTKLNRSHLAPGKEALILPCLGRTEKDMQASGEQGITVEDAMAMVHLSKGMKAPASEHLLSELAILAKMAKAAVPDSVVPWDAWVGNYDLVRDKMAEAIDGFQNFNTLVRQAHGFRLPQAARERRFITPTGKANFSHAELPDILPKKGRLVLSTVRSHDQWNTTIYSDNDRYRGVKNLRTLIFMNAHDMRERGVGNMQLVNITSFAKDGSVRGVKGFRAVEYDIPKGCTTGYMPELNVLLAVGDYSAQSDQPLMKQIQIEVHPCDALPPA